MITAQRYKVTYIIKINDAAFIHKEITTRQLNPEDQKDLFSVLNVWTI